MVEEAPEMTQAEVDAEIAASRRVQEEYDRRVSEVKVKTVEHLDNTYSPDIHYTEDVPEQRAMLMAHERLQESAAHEHHKALAAFIARLPEEMRGSAEMLKAQLTNHEMSLEEGVRYAAGDPLGDHGARPSAHHLGIHSGVPRVGVPRVGLTEYDEIDVLAEGRSTTRRHRNALHELAEVQKAADTAKGSVVVVLTPPPPKKTKKTANTTSSQGPSVFFQCIRFWPLMRGEDL